LITPIQIAQFVIAMLSITYESFHVSDCASNATALYWMWFTYAVFLFLFIKLYGDKMEERSGASQARDGKEKPQ